MQNFYTEFFFIVTVIGRCGNFRSMIIDPVWFRGGRVGHWYYRVEVGGGSGVGQGGVVTSIVVGVTRGRVHGCVDTRGGALGVILVIITFFITIRKIVLITRVIMRKNKF